MRHFFNLLGVALLAAAYLQFFRSQGPATASPMAGPPPPGLSSEDASSASGGGMVLVASARRAATASAPDAQPH